jgi:TonB family protein
VRFCWGDQTLGEEFLAPGVQRTLSVGSAAGVDVVMGDARLGAPRFEAVRAGRDGYAVRFTGKMKGALTRAGETLDLQAAIESGRATHEGEAYVLALEPGDDVRVDLGGVMLEAWFQPVPRRVVAPLSESVDFTVLNLFLVLFFVAALFVISAHNRDLGGAEYADELSNNNARIAKLIIKPPETRKNKFLEQLAHQKEARKSGQMAAKNRGEEGKMGKKTAQPSDRRTAPQGDPNKAGEARALAKQIFGSGKGGGLSTVFGKDLGGDLKGAMGNMFGRKVGDAQGLGGMGIRGSGSGGGGTGQTVGIGGVGTRGKGGGDGSYGTGVGVLGGKKGVDIGIASSEPTVTGSLDKELIRQVVRANIGQIRYCYESQLTRFPKLSGKVAIRWVIREDGRVATSSVAQSTAGNAELETCVAGRVRTWQFPKPKGGGMVVVTYPFVFKQSGE